MPAFSTAPLSADFAALGLVRRDNSEGMCWGPPLPGWPEGQRMRVVVSDDNFNPLQTAQFAAFAFAYTARLTDRP